MGMNPDKDWERFGTMDPYYGVYSDDRFRKESMTEKNVEDFFRSGEEFIEGVFRTVDKNLLPGFHPERALDFGCGTGRLLIPLSRRCGEVVGADVSGPMLEEARNNLEIRSIRNVTLVKSDDGLGRLPDRSFGFILSFIVFQHIPVPRGLKIYPRLLEKLAAGGVGVIHFTYHRDAPAYRKLVNWARVRVPLANGVINVLQGRGFGEPMARMNLYPLERIFEIGKLHGITGFHVELTNHSGYRGAILFFRKA